MIISHNYKVIICNYDQFKAIKENCNIKKHFNPMYDTVVGRRV